MAGQQEDDHVTALALAAGRGDQAALADWVRATQAEVWRLLAHLTDAHRADDLTQETYLRALSSLPRFAGRSSARTWLLSIARRVVVDHIRASPARPRPAATGDWEPVADQQAWHARAARAGFEELAELNLLLASLALDRREALVLTQLLGLSYEEAAQVCGCAVGTIRSRVAGARDDLVEYTDHRGRGAL